MSPLQICETKNCGTELPAFGMLCRLQILFVTTYCIVLYCIVLAQLEPFTGGYNGLQVQVRTTVLQVQMYQPQVFVHCLLSSAELVSDVFTYATNHR